MLLIKLLEPEAGSCLLVLAVMPPTLKALLDPGLDDNIIFF